MPPFIFSIIIGCVIFGLCVGLFLICLKALRYSFAAFIISTLFFIIGGFAASVFFAKWIEKEICNTHDDKVCIETQFINAIDIDNRKIQYIEESTKKLITITLGKSIDMEVYYDLPESIKDCFNRVEYRNGIFSWEVIEVHLQETRK